MYAVNSFEHAPRFMVALPVALFMTLFLLFAMGQLIRIDIPVINEEPYPVFPPVVMDPPDPKPLTIVKPEPIEPPQPQPPLPVREWETPQQLDTTVTRVPLEFPDQAVVAAADSLPFARVMAPPVYPFRAAQRGVEGFVDIRFDVAASGATRNIQVVYAQPQGIFEDSALAAVARWRFQPRMVNGQPAPFVGLSKRIRFTLEK